MVHYDNSSTNSTFVPGLSIAINRYENYMYGDLYSRENQTYGENLAVLDDLPHFFSPRKAQQVATATVRRGLPYVYTLYNELGIAR